MYVCVYKRERERDWGPGWEVLCGLLEEERTQPEKAQHHLKEQVTNLPLTQMVTQMML